MAVRRTVSITASSEWATRRCHVLGAIPLSSREELRPDAVVNTIAPTAIGAGFDI
jgi:hypothetical protein